MISIVFVLMVQFSQQLGGEVAALGTFDTPQACTWVSTAMNSHQDNQGQAYFGCVEKEVTDV